MSAFRMLPLLLAIAVSQLRADEPDYRSYFTYPDARIVITIGTSHSECVPFKNHSIPQKAGERASFGNGFASSIHRTDEPAITWSFLRKMKDGDLYKFTIQRKGMPDETKTVLFVNLTVFAYDKDGIVVQIDPYKDAGH